MVDNNFRQPQTYYGFRKKKPVYPLNPRQWGFERALLSSGAGCEFDIAKNLLTALYNK